MSLICPNVAKIDENRYKKLYRFPYLEEWTARLRQTTDVQISGSSDVFFVNHSGSNQYCFGDLSAGSISKQKKRKFRFNNFINAGEICKFELVYNVYGQADDEGAETLSSNVSLHFLQSSEAGSWQLLYSIENMNFLNTGELIVTYGDYIPFYYNDNENKNRLNVVLENNSFNNDQVITLPWVTLHIVGIGTIDWCEVTSDVGEYIEEASL